jgi:tRNA uridine 5-carboxymethylaminomethyl modification enzyme
VYIEKERSWQSRSANWKNYQFLQTFDYDRISAISAEALQKFKRIKPRTLGQASRN